MKKEPVKAKKIDKKPLLDRQTNIMLVVNEYPEAVDVLQAFGLHCTSCFASVFDTIGQGAQMHGMDDNEIDEMIKEANMVIKKSKKVDIA
jgi:hybrid cluster-associated redox disulfide protein